MSGCFWTIDVLWTSKKKKGRRKKKEERFEKTTKTKTKTNSLFFSKRNMGNTLANGIRFVFVTSPEDDETAVRKHQMILKEHAHASDLWFVFVVFVVLVFVVLVCLWLWWCGLVEVVGCYFGYFGCFSCGSWGCWSVVVGGSDCLFGFVVYTF